MLFVTCRLFAALPPPLSCQDITVASFRLRLRLHAPPILHHTHTPSLNPPRVSQVTEETVKMTPPMDDDAFLRRLSEKRKHLTARMPTPAARYEQPEDVTDGMLQSMAVPATNTKDGEAAGPTGSETPRLLVRKKKHPRRRHRSGRRSVNNRRRTMRRRKGRPRQKAPKTHLRNCRANRRMPTNRQPGTGSI
jgi:hypothetical protein